jgi:hypothetical protein
LANRAVRAEHCSREEVVHRGDVEDAWGAVLDGAGLEGGWTLRGSDLDEYLCRVVTWAAARLGADEQTVLWMVAQGSLSLPSSVTRTFMQSTDG